MDYKKFRGRDSEATRSAVLDAAQRLFAAKGFAGTSMREISSASGISQPLIHYHFGSKEGLYTAVRERIIKGIRSILLPSDGAPDTSADPARLVRTGFNYVCGNEDLMRLIAWSHLEREYSEWPGEQELTLLLAGHIQRHLGDTRSDKGFNPIIMAIMIKAAILFWSQNRESYSRLFEESPEQVTDRYLDHIESLFFSAKNTKE